MDVKYDREQEAVIMDPSRFLQVIASAGSGKTKTMVGVVERSLEQGVGAEEILVLSFTRKAAGEIRNRILHRVGRTNVRVHTFHSFCFQALARWHPDFRKRTPSIVLPMEKNAFFREWFRKDPFLVGGIPYELLADLRSLPEDFPKEWYEELQKDYRAYKTSTGKLDFDDLVHLFLRSLEEREPWTEIPRNLLKKILVDEFQDTNSEQLVFLRNLSESSSIVVVGDDAQSIYGFRGADVKLFLDFPRFFQGTSRHLLITNYRSLPKIVEASDIPIRKNRGKITKEVRAHRKGKAFVGRILINGIPDLFPFLENAYLTCGKNWKILCRSNHRIREYLRAGIPEDFLLTIHSAKGLEFHTVFVDLADGWNVKWTSSEEILEEERRILYVALSRAEDSLAIVGSRTRNARETAEDLFFSYFDSLPLWKKPPQ
ncbi:damage-inducible protein [Leptospira fletcheri]|uniref:DNA 3'-5' helicase n=1 Tax=Leptospira fletcheri TaxID=2484981 RepID=A0A4V3JE01_9LEPT|nr:UvrD-helicase domain-containing protein [Leptospira fletcheri]TGK12892.1 damage-inducible protein [Leptospira fletcheri]